MTSALWLAALAVALAFSSGAVSLFAGRARRLLRFQAMPLVALSGAAATAAGLAALWQGGTVSTDLPLGLPWRRVRGLLCELRGGGQCHPGGCSDPRLPTHAAGPGKGTVGRLELNDRAVVR